MDWSDYEVEGQLSITDYLKSQIELRKVDDFTAFLNKQGKSQYQQIGEVVSKAYETYKDEENMLDRITNCVSIYVLDQSRKYAEYLRNESQLN